MCVLPPDFYFIRPVLFVFFAASPMHNAFKVLYAFKRKNLLLNDRFMCVFFAVSTNGGGRINGWLLISYFLKLDSTKSFVLLPEDIKSLWIFHLYVLFWISMYRSFLTLKVLNVRKTSVAWHLSTIKCNFYLLNYFLCTIQT